MPITHNFTKQTPVYQPPSENISNTEIEEAITYKIEAKYNHWIYLIYGE